MSLSILWDRLVGITDEIISALVRSSFSTIVRESGDLSVVVLDAEGNSMAQGSYSVPSFNGTASRPSPTASTRAASTSRASTTRFACRAEVEGRGIALDFAGTSPPVHRGINVPFCYTRAMACYAVKCLTVTSVKCLTVTSMPNNEGAVAPIRVGAPEDSILNAQPPYPI